jgi:hypothetical protein
MRYSSAAGHYAGAGMPFQALFRSILPRSSPQFEGVAAYKTTSTCSPVLQRADHLTSVEAAVRSRACGVYSWWCPSVNFFKFQPCDHTPPGTQKLVLSCKVPNESKNNIVRSLVRIVYGIDYDGICFLIRPVSEPARLYLKGRQAPTPTNV